MDVYPAKPLRFESNDFASVIIDDVGYSRRHQCPPCVYIIRYTNIHKI